MTINIVLQPSPNPSPARPRTGSWRHAPQRLLLRRAIFQIHLWLGLLVTLYAVVIGVTGSALVFRPDLERSLRPSTVHLGGSGPRRPLAALVAEAERTRPGWRVSAVRDFSQPDQATSLLMYPVHRTLATGDYRLVSVHPWTGTELADTMRFGGVLGWLTNLHFYLLADSAGLRLSGWFALALLLLALTGIVVWWPGVRRALDSVLFHRRGSWKRINWDLHSVVGFWSATWLVLLCVTGLYFAFPAPVEIAVLRLTGSSLAEARRHDAFQPHPPSRCTVPVLTVDQAAALSRAALPVDAPPDYLSLPAQPGAPYYVTGYFHGTAPYSQQSSVALDPCSGAVLSRSDTHDQPFGQRLIQLFFALHFGSFAGEGFLGTLVKLLWVILGLTPALLAVTGVLMFFNRKLSPMLKRRRAARI